MGYLPSNTRRRAAGGIPAVATDRLSELPDGRPRQPHTTRYKPADRAVQSFRLDGSSEANRAAVRRRRTRPMAFATPIRLFLLLVFEFQASESHGDV